MTSNSTHESTRRRIKWFSVNREMLPCKVMYFLFGGLVGSYGPYMPVFLTSIGFTLDQVGLLIGIQYIASSIANPLWRYFADHMGKRKLALFLLCLGSVVFIVPMPWIARVLKNIDSTNETSVYTNNTSASGNQKIHSSVSKEFNATVYYALLTLTSTAALFYPPLKDYVFTTTANVVRNSRTKASYGAQRIFGSIGFAGTSFLVGVAADHYHESDMSPYTPVFYIVLFYLLTSIPVGHFLIGRGNFNSSTKTDGSEKPTQTFSVLKLLWKMMKKPDNVFFFFTLIVSGISDSIFVNFTLLLIEHEIPNITKAMMSLIFVVECASNVIMFPLSAKFIRLLHGPSQAIILSLSAYFIYFMVMSFTKVFAIMVAMSALNGLSFALMWAAMIEKVHKIAPKEIILTVFMLVNSVYFGVCGLIGNIVGGKVFHMYGGRAFFRGVAVLCGVWVSVMIVYRVVMCLRKREDLEDENLCKTELLEKENTFARAA